MSKYKPLGEYLARQTASPLTLTFKEIEGVLGAPLPVCAFGHRAWWANDKRPGRQAESWLSRGWHSGKVDLDGRRVTFRNNGNMSKYDPLGEHLARQAASPVTLAFEEIVEVLGEPLPPKAYALRSWWGNVKGRSHSKAWTSRGWRVKHVDLGARSVTFRRGRKVRSRKR